jgi:5-methylcytosine-specific restriction enzyme A
MTNVSSKLVKRWLYGHGWPDGIRAHIPLSDAPEKYRNNPPPKKFKKLKKLRQLAAQQNTCYYCNCQLDLSSATWDHKTPISRGGTNDLDNLVIACEQCNFNKDDLTEQEFKEYLRAKELYVGKR